MFALSSVKHVEPFLLPWFFHQIKPTRYECATPLFAFTICYMDGRVLRHAFTEGIKVSHVRLEQEVV